MRVGVIWCSSLFCFCVFAVLLHCCSIPFVLFCLFEYFFLLNFGRVLCIFCSFIALIFPMKCVLLQPVFFTVLFLSFSFHSALTCC
ncbi:putative mucin-associated surface protein (MASP) [Trypanosoma cruzi Dm28c]|uniref:Putative mucin-associated surface protein (MASP) n=1 Tax=Trypanosoma cruzi Dm28c TaxID=1416333 RepID=V5AR70_TRYCR|nr:putative mucin-associated surface protein (MASP) [Trypanosoma cruzi Dm28c]